jgi:hypothetical protein
MAGSRRLWRLVHCGCGRPAPPTYVYGSDAPKGDSDESLTMEEAGLIAAAIMQISTDPEVYPLLRRS